MLTTYFIDLLVDHKIVLELKAVDAISQAHLSQVLTYLKAARLQLGIVLNFGTASLEQRRVVL